MGPLERLRGERHAETTGITETDIRYACRAVLKREPDPRDLTAHGVRPGRLLYFDLVPVAGDDRRRGTADSALTA